MKHQDVEKVLKRLGLEEVSRTKKAIGFASAGDLVEVYVNTETKSSSNTLVIQPHYLTQKQDLLNISGVIAGVPPERFSSNYRQFPKKETPKGKENYYGIPFGFSEPSALEEFLDVLGLVVAEPA
ncbi:DUF2002 family protein [Endozoicomonas lisbonensis]|uniref:Uncharacterized protein n=1 Tax=Endozoicomonas lisbonensis TaxID=3120522 RepID=A0ABV2SL80_9GAMM